MNWIDEIVEMYLNGHTIKAISKKLKIDEDKIIDTVKELGLEGYRSCKVSKPQELIYEACCKLFGRDRVRQEFYLENKSRADIAVPDFYLVVEYHGEQHFRFIDFFHKDIEAFKRQKIADEKKAKYCSDRGWVFVVFTPEDDMEEKALKRKIMNAVLAHAVEEQQPMSNHRNSYMDSKNKSQREYRRQQYRNIKEFRHNRKRSNINE